MSSIQAVDIDGNFHEVREDEIQWKVHAYGILIKDGKILLSPQHGGRYDLPGGKVDIDESLEGGLVREVKEETGIDVLVTEQLVTKDILFKVTFREPQEVWHSVMVYYLCEQIGGEISVAGFDEHEAIYAKKAEWVEIDKLDDISAASSYDWRELIPRAG